MMFNMNYFMLRALLAAATISPALAIPEHTIVGGTESTPGQFPYFVNYGCCGGALIAPDIVLTAAHCDVDVCDVRNSDFYIGAYEQYTTNEGAQVRSCETWVNDPKWNSETKEYDFALCKLNSPVTIDESLVTLELNEDDSFPIIGTNTIGMGMGGTLQNDGQDENFDQVTSSTLKNVTLPTYSNDDCANYYANIGDMNLCTMVAAGGEDTCQGDSGGPLVVRSYQGDGTFKDIHVGVVSYGAGCAMPDTPGVYARTSNNLEWIKTTACDDLGSVASFCSATVPTLSPTVAPVGVPTVSPVGDSPTAQPTSTSTEISSSSSSSSTSGDDIVDDSPTMPPTMSPTMSPTKAPTMPPTMPPTKAPTKAPTATPTKTAKKTKSPKKTETPTKPPTKSPTKTPKSPKKKKSSKSD